MDIIRLYTDNRIPFITEGKNVGDGWVNITCPFCDDPSEHLGYNTSMDYYRCWRCGWHPTNKVVSKILNISTALTHETLKQYGGEYKKQIKEEHQQIRPFVFPSGVTSLQRQHKQYLENRGFDPARIERIWKLMGTGPVSMLDDIDYKHRIIAPILWEGETVSFQSRSLSDKAELRYKACSKEREVLHHKDILYHQIDRETKIGICTEGITDVWRMGENSFATFGIGYTEKQVTCISKLFSVVFIIYDPEPLAQKQAERLKNELRFRGVKTELITIDSSDPASMKQEDANYLVKQLIGRSNNGTRNHR